jgi:hypothetical protein
MHADLKPAHPLREKIEEFVSETQDVDKIREIWGEDIHYRFRGQKGALIDLWLYPGGISFYCNIGVVTQTNAGRILIETSRLVYEDGVTLLPCLFPKEGDPEHSVLSLILQVALASFEPDYIVFLVDMSDCLAGRIKEEFSLELLAMDKD